MGGNVVYDNDWEGVNENDVGGFFEDVVVSFVG